MTRPPISTMPVSGSIEPAATAMSVDLPAPFSPTSAWTSPSTTSRPTPLRATTPGNVLTTSVRRRTTRASGMSLRRLPVLADRGLRQLVRGVEVGRGARYADRVLTADRVLEERELVRARLLVGEPLRGGDRLAGGHPAEPVARRDRRELELRVALVHLLVEARETVGVERADRHELAVGGLHGARGGKGVRAVVRDDPVDLLVLGEQRAHLLLRGRRIPVRHGPGLLTGQELHTGVLGEALDDRLQLARGNRVAGRTAEEDDVALAVEQLDHPVGPHRARDRRAPVDVGDVVLARRAARIGAPRDDLDAGRRGLLDRRELRLAEVGDEHDRIGALGDHRVDVGDRLLEGAAADDDDLLDVRALRGLGAHGCVRLLRPRVDAEAVVDSKRD